MTYISKDLKEWVKSDLSAMNEAYNECWKQRQQWQDKAVALKKVEIGLKQWLRDTAEEDEFIFIEDVLAMIKAIK